MSKRANSLTLHELASKNFRRTPNGLIFSDDLKAVYSVLLICLDLKEKSSEPRGLLKAFSKPHPFSFTVQDAVNKMSKLELQVDSNSTCIAVSYHIKETLAYHLLKVFMSAKLLHTPADRTRSEPKEKVQLQPTPKGVAIAQKYARDIGLKKIPEILLSSFNSTELFTFERSTSSDSIIHSDYLVHILFIKMMGKNKNVWSPNKASDKLPSLSKLLAYDNNSFSFENRGLGLYGSFNKMDQSNDIEISWSDQIPDELLQKEDRSSTFAHRFFTNPDSDSHIQYYVSDCGLRLFESKVFGKNKTIIDYCFSTKSIWQWLMDCTDIIYPKEAILVAALFLKTGLIVPILLEPSENSNKKFKISRSSYFTFSKAGWDIVSWDSGTKSCKPDKIQETFSEVRNCKVPNNFNIDVGYAVSSNLIVPDDRTSLSDNLDSEQEQLPHVQFKSLDDILHDPGMRYLFRSFLEKDFCAENLDVYIDIKKFLKKMTLLKKLIENSKNYRNGKFYDNNIISTIDSALMNNANECLEMAYHIYSTYVMVNAPYQLNIDYSLREAIASVMLHPQSPLSDSSPGSLPKKGISGVQSSVKPRRLPIPEQLMIDEPMTADLPENDLNKFKDIRISPGDIVPSPLYLAPISQNINMNNILRNGADNHLDDALVSTIKILKKLYPLFEKVSQHMYRLMDINSLQSFQKSDIFKETVCSFGAP